MIVVRVAQEKWHHLQTAMRRNAGRVFGSRSYSELTSADYAYAYQALIFLVYHVRLLCGAHRPAATEVHYSNPSATRVQSPFSKI